MERARQSPADIRLALKAAGFSPVACFGKAPMLSEWQNRRDATPEEIAKWPGGNSGIDTKYDPGLDIDVDDAEAAACIEATARDWFDGRGTIPVRFGRAPRRALLFRAATPFAKIIAKFVAPNGSKHKIEFLGDGQQIIAHGIHPDTGTSYAWHADLAPWNMKREDLVEIDEAEAHAFIDSYCRRAQGTVRVRAHIGWQRTRHSLAVCRRRRRRRPDRGAGSAVAGRRRTGQRRLLPRHSRTAATGRASRRRARAGSQRGNGRCRTRRSRVEPAKGDQAGRCDDPLANTATWAFCCGTTTPQPAPFRPACRETSTKRGCAC